jgi:hypothetical protein
VQSTKIQPTFRYLRGQILNKIRDHPELQWSRSLASYFISVYCLAQASVLKMKAKYFSEISVDIHRTKQCS